MDISKQLRTTIGLITCWEDIYVVQGKSFIKFTTKAPYRTSWIAIHIWPEGSTIENNSFLDEGVAVEVLEYYNDAGGEMAELITRRAEFHGFTRG